MAKIILRARPVNSYTVETKTIDTPDKKPVNINSVELVITPVKGNTIDAKDFTFGVLPNIISNISYYNTDSAISTANKVVAVVNFNNESISTGFINLNLPISGLSRVTSKTLLLTEVNNIDKNVLVSTTTIGSVESTNIITNSRIHRITSLRAGSVKVLTKKYSIPNGYVFVKEPSYSVSGNGYSVSVNKVRDYNGVVKEVTFNVVYNFPELNPMSEIKNTITFTASSKEEVVDREVFTAVKDEDYKIYNVDLGRKIGSEGGVKNIKINGVPGTKFKILVQDTNKKLYDFKRGGFRTGAKRGFLEGIIPPAERGFGYGTYNAYVKIDPSTTANTITTKIQEFISTFLYSYTGFCNNFSWFLTINNE